MREKTRELLGKRSLVFSVNQAGAARFDPDRYRGAVEMAAEFGATHMGVGWLPYEYTWYLPDSHDPYASWSNTGLGIFRVFPPEELQEWIPVDEARRLQAIIRAQLDIMRPYGMKGTATGCEPLWLPEGIYRAHPHWRGAQCELGRIARRPYFAPSVDEPEVLALYRKAFKEIAQKFPEIEQFDFMANDSGSGLAWAPTLYPGMNGPAKWRLRDGGERVADWLKAMQDGAADAGVHVRVNSWGHGMTPEMIASARAKLRPGLFVKWGNGRESFGGPGAGLSGGLWSAYYPALGLGDPADFISGLQAVYSNPKNDDLLTSISVDAWSLPLARTLLETYLEEPGTGLVNRTRTLLRAAERLSGSADEAERLIGVWDDVRLAAHSVMRVTQKGFGLVVPFGCVSNRWIVRPLVPEPAKLTPAEIAHYRRHLFTVDSDEMLADYCCVLGKPVFRGEGAMWMARWALQDAINRLQGARQTVRAMADRCQEPEARKRLSLYAARVGAFGCLAANARNTVMYQYALDTAAQPQFGPNMMDYDDNIMYDQRALTMRKIAREEVDNTADLIALMKSESEPVLAHASQPSEESVFLLGPDLLGDLRRKLDIMMDHWQDYERLYPSTKPWDFEPEPMGNIVRPPSHEAE